MMENNKKNYMKQFLVMVGLCGLIFFSLAQTTSFAQTTLGLATDKTTSLIFPFSILHIDRGTKDLLVQRIKEANNILLVKAATRDFPETNLSVFTSDGSVYSFTICYQSSPGVWVYHLPANKYATMEAYATAVMDNPRLNYRVKKTKWDISSRLAGLYINKGVMYFQLQIENKSPIDYDIDFLKFYIRDKRKGKRTAIQETELNPLCVVGNTYQVLANCSNTIVVALDKFTIPDAKYFGVQIMEKNGGRHFLLRMGNRTIIQATVLPDLR